MESNVTVKASFGDDMRRFKFTSKRLDDLKAFLKTIFSIPVDISVKYLDDENDWISLTNDDELGIALIECGNILKLRVEEKTPSVSYDDRQFDSSKDDSMNEASAPQEDYYDDQQQYCHGHSSCKHPHHHHPPPGAQGFGWGPFGGWGWGHGHPGHGRGRGRGGHRRREKREKKGKNCQESCWSGFAKPEDQSWEDWGKKIGEQCAAWGEQKGIFGRDIGEKFEEFGHNLGKQIPTFMENFGDSISSHQGLDASFVSHVTVHEGTEVPPDNTFTKIWKVRNSGNCGWNKYTKLVWVRGDRFQHNDYLEVSVPAAEPGEVVDVAVTLNAPDFEGRFQSYWRLCTSYGVKFGDDLVLDIVTAKEGKYPSPDFEQF